VKIKSFQAKRVHGYLDFEIVFNKNINFLVGGNGSGKTTALRLINAVLGPNFRDLILIPFDDALLMVEDGGEAIFVAAATEGDYKTLQVSGSSEKIVLPLFRDYELEQLIRSQEKLDELVTEYNRRFAEHAVIKKLSTMVAPIFLGLDRKSDRGTSGSQDHFVGDRWKRSTSDRERVAKRFARASANSGLLETEQLVQDAYGRLRELEDVQALTLRDSVLLSAFKFTDYSTESVSQGVWKDRGLLPKRKKEIKEALSKIGVKDSRLGSQLDKFFDRLTTFAASTEARPQDLAWALLNKAQIDRMHEIVEIIDEHKSKVDQIFEPINRFLSTINGFYRESNKALELDSVGRISITRAGGTSSLEGLSSGELQLLVIFAHVLLNRTDAVPDRVFIIDEPELSLHLSWQERFSETIFALTPETQFIMATHSPDIVGDNKSSVIRCR
jgi:predicted ATP-dependent endonuclease of OLD family